MDAVMLWGRAAVEHPDRVSATTAIGVDETSFLAATATEGTRWVSSICDVEGRSVIDVIEGRQAPDLDRWLTDQPEEWKSGVTITVCDLHEPFRAALARHLPDAMAVADPFHVVAVGTRPSTAAASSWPWARSAWRTTAPPSCAACSLPETPTATCMKRGGS